MNDNNAIEISPVLDAEVVEPELNLPESVAHLVGERVHGLDPAGIVVILEPGDDEFFAYPRTTTLGRGQELVLTADILRASLDRKGNSIWALDEYAQRDAYNGTPRWGFGPYPDSERLYDIAHTPDNSRLVQTSTIVASYSGDRGDHDIRRHGGLRPGLRAQ